MNKMSMRTVKMTCQTQTDKGLAWLIVLGNFISLLCMIGILKSFGIFLNEFVECFNVPVALAALIMGVCGGVYTIAAPVCVAAGEHFGQRKVVMLGGLVGGLGLCLSALLFNIQWVVVTFGALLGFGNACLFGNGLVMIGKYFNKRRSLANGLAQTGASVGQFALPPLLQLLLDTYALKGTLVIMGAIYLNVIVCGTMYRPLTVHTRRCKQPNGEDETLIATVKTSSREITKEDFDSVTVKVERSENAGARIPVVDATVASKNAIDINTTTDASASVNDKHEHHNNTAETNDQLHLHVPSGLKSGQTKLRTIVASWKRFLVRVLDFRVCKNSVVIVFVSAGFLLFFGYYNFVMFMPATAASRGIPKYRAAWLVSINGLSDLVGRVLVGVVGDLNIIQRYKIMALSTVLCGTAIFCFSFAESFLAMSVFVGIYGFSGGCYICINVPTLIDFVGLETMPKVLGVLLFIQGLAYGVGQPLLGLVRDAMGVYDVVHYINSASMIAGSALLMVYPLVKKREEKKLTGQEQSDNNTT